MYPQCEGIVTRRKTFSSPRPEKLVNILWIIKRRALNQNAPLKILSRVPDKSSIRRRNNEIKARFTRSNLTRQRIYVHISIPRARG